MAYMKQLIADKVYVQVWLNLNETGLNFHYGYREDDRLMLAVEYYTDSELVATGSAYPALGQAFEQLNIDEPTSDWAKAYRQAGLRSLSVGDVVVVGELAYACESVGWKSVSLQSNQCDSTPRVNITVADVDGQPAIAYQPGAVL